MRKFSSHGLGTYASQRDYVSREDIPAPWTKGGSALPLGGYRWSYDLWYDFIVALETGQTEQADGGSILRNGHGGIESTIQACAWNPPAMHQVTLSTWNLFVQYSSEYQGVLRDVRPFNFITVLPGMNGRTLFSHMARAQNSPQAKELLPLSEAEESQPFAQRHSIISRFFADYTHGSQGAFFCGYAPSAQAYAERQERGEVYTNVNGRALPVPRDVECVRLFEMIGDYFSHPEQKAAIPDSAGDVGVRSIAIKNIALVGKETNARHLMSAIESGGIIGGSEAGLDGATIYGLDRHVDTWAEARGKRDYAALLKPYSLADLVLVTGIRHQTLSAIRRGKTKEPDKETVPAILTGLPFLDAQNPDNILGWRTDVPNSYLASCMGWTVDGAFLVADVRRGERRLSPEERERFIRAIEEYRAKMHEDNDDDEKSTEGAASAARTDVLSFLQELWQAESPAMQE